MNPQRTRKFVISVFPVHGHMKKPIHMYDAIGKNTIKVKHTVSKRKMSYPGSIGLKDIVQQKKGVVKGINQLF